jgi:hypothetical protein
LRFSAGPAPGERERRAREPFMRASHRYTGETAPGNAVACAAPIYRPAKTLLETGKPLEISYPAREGVRD